MSRTVVITGCASGIGAAAVRRFAEEPGVTIIGVDRNASSDPAVSRTVIGDLSSRAGVEAVAEQITEDIDVLVNNAGVSGTMPWRTVLSINTLAPRDLTQLLLPQFTRDASVVTTASQAGFMWSMNFDLHQKALAVDDWDEALGIYGERGDIDTAAYGLSKEAAIVCTGNFTIAAKALGVRANTVSPGTVDTPLLPSFRESMGAEMIDGASRWAGRHAKPSEIAEGMYFLTSPAASWVNGIDLPIDGGFSPFVYHTYVAPAMGEMMAATAAMGEELATLKAQLAEQNTDAVEEQA
ncbi:MAG: SDR family oxidoreductase [Propionibacterium sp.]|nr:SDR family oxidoreductase [Propionibacterium sp.]